MRFLVVLGLVFALGCGATREDNPFRAVGPGLIRIEVDNRNFNDATVFAIIPGGQRRLGIVTGKTAGSFDLQWTRDQDIRLRIQLLAGDSFSTNALYVRQGEILQLTIDPILRRTLLRR